MTKPNVEVITSGIAAVRARSIVDGAGVERPADAIIFGTGFRPTDPPLAARVSGRGGRTMSDVWQGSPQAHLGTTLAGFPNLFMLLGPNTGLGHNSVVYMIEAQIEHFVGALRYMRAHGVEAIEPAAEAQRRSVATVDRRMRGTVWVSGGCRSWYLDGTGRNSTLWPDSSWRFHRLVSRFRPAEYQVAAASTAPDFLSA
jgi:cation diffusion facilitator CzcD-associated flavoprotein CzcO